jgi:magnesium-transporting ATPase (P-type)
VKCTGDNAATTASMCKASWFWVCSKTISGDELMALSEGVTDTVMDTTIFRMFQAKLKIINTLKSNKSVAMTGDGVNDGLP